MDKKLIKKEIKKYAVLLVSNFFLAAALIAFINNAGIMTGGLGGISIFFGKLFPEFEYITSFVITIVSWLLFLVGFIFKGKHFAVKTLFSTITYPLFITLFEYFFHQYGNFLPAAFETIATETGDVIIYDTGMQIVYSLLAGVFVGIGLGLAFKVGGSTGGVDIPSVIIAEKFHISIDQVIFMIDVVIIASGFIVLPFTNVIIGIISNVVYTYVIDKIIVGGKKSLVVHVISDKVDEINEFVKTKLDRGSTYIDVRGGYKGAEHKLLQIVVYRREYSRLVDYINTVDENAFVVSLEAKEVFGEGFKQYDQDVIK